MYDHSHITPEIRQHIATLSTPDSQEAIFGIASAMPGAYKAIQETALGIAMCLADGEPADSPDIAMEVERFRTLQERHADSKRLLWESGILWDELTGTLSLVKEA